MQGLPNDVKAIIYKMLYDEVLKQIFKPVLLKSREYSCLRVKSDSVYFDYGINIRQWVYRCVTEDISKRFYYNWAPPLWMNK